MAKPLHPERPPQRPEEDSPPRAERERRRLRAHAAAAAMFGLEPRDRADFAATFPDCQTAEFVELMIGLAREVRSADPAAAADRLILGLTAAEGGDAAGRERMATARACATTEAGNAYRLSGRLGLAERTLAEARRQAATLGSLEILVAIDGLRIQLLSAQGRMDPMRDLVRQTLAAAARVSPHTLGKVHFIAGVTLEHQPASTEALDHNEAGLRLIEARWRPRLAGSGLHNLGYQLVRLGRPEDGRYFLRRAFAVFQRVGSPVDRARSLWSASWADWIEGSFEAAIDRLEIAARRLASLGQPIVAGIAFLDLSRALACRGRWLQAEQVARTSLGIFGSCDAPHHLSITETVLAEARRTGRRSGDRVAEAVEAVL